MRFSQSFLSEIKRQLPISQVIGARIKFDTRKSVVSRGDYWGCCPFHQEKTPSFHCDDKRGKYHCFGCQESGDHFEFLIRLDNISFFESVEYLARLAGLPLPVLDPTINAQLEKKDFLYKALEKAAVFFEEMLRQDTIGVEARSYLKKRDIHLNSQTKFRIGFAPKARRSLIDYLEKKGVSFALLEACGLAIKDDKSGFGYDRFRNRLMFPILDLHGRVVAFGGRTLDPNNPVKYINSPETEVFTKGHLVYNFTSARQEILNEKKNGNLLKLCVVEGYLDVIRLDQSQIRSSVAILGTALTEEQLFLLWKIAPTPIICFDGDRAGVQAAYRTLERSLPYLSGKNFLNFCFLPQGQDPDDFLRNNGTQAFYDLITTPQSVCDVLWELATKDKLLLGPESYADLEQNLSQILSKMQNRELKYYYWKDLKNRVFKFFSKRHGFLKKEEAYESSKNKLTRIQNYEMSESLSHSKLTHAAFGLSKELNFSSREIAIFTLFMTYPVFISDFYSDFIQLDFKSDLLIKLRETMLDILTKDEIEDSEFFLKILKQQGQQQIVSTLYKKAKKTGLWKTFTNKTKEDARKMLEQALELQRRSSRMDYELKELELNLRENPEQDIQSLLANIKEEFKKL